MHICMYVCMYVCVCVFVCAYMCMFVCVTTRELRLLVLDEVSCIYVCVCVYIYIYIYIYIYTARADVYSPIGLSVCLRILHADAVWLCLCTSIRMCQVVGSIWYMVCVYVHM